jgi:hypothetical protein
MAQVNSTCNELYKITASLLNANAMFITCDAGDMSGFTAATNAPATEIVTNGFGRQAGTRSVLQTVVANDTMQIFYLYTANANQNVNGHEVMSANASGNMYGYCKYNALQPCQTNDTLNAIMQFQSEVGA